jgi:hypothetical protein
VGSVAPPLGAGEVVEPPLGEVVVPGEDIESPALPGLLPVLPGDDVGSLELEPLGELEGALFIMEESSPVGFFIESPLAGAFIESPEVFFFIASPLFFFFSAGFVVGLA